MFRHSGCFASSRESKYVFRLRDIVPYRYLGIGMFKPWRHKNASSGIQGPTCMGFHATWLSADQLRDSLHSTVWVVAWCCMNIVRSWSPSSMSRAYKNPRVWSVYQQSPETCFKSNFRSAKFAKFRLPGMGQSFGMFARTFIETSAHLEVVPLPRVVAAWKILHHGLDDSNHFWQICCRRGLWALDAIWGLGV